MCAWIAAAFTNPVAIAALAEDTEEDGSDWHSITLQQRVAYEFVLSVAGLITDTIEYLETDKAEKPE